MNLYKNCLFFLIFPTLINAHGFATHTLVKSNSEYWWVIEQVVRLSKKEKQYVLSYDVSSEYWTNQQVQSGAHSITNCYVKIGLPQSFIICTPTQEFYLAEIQKWIPAYQLQINDVLLADKNNHVKVRSIDFVHEHLDVYSIQVKDTHTFLVSPHSVITHNMVIPAVAAGLSIPFSTGCSGGAMGAAFGPIGFIGGLAIGGVIGCAIKFGMNNKVAEYKLNYDVDKIESYFESKDKKEVKKEKKKSTVNDITSEAAPGDKTKGKTKLFEKPGGFSEAESDFDELGPINIKEIPTGRVGKLSDGRVVNVRKKSSDGRPTLEIYNGKSSIKIRYNA